MRPPEVAAVHGEVDDGNAAAAGPEQGRVTHGGTEGIHERKRGQRPGQQQPTRRIHLRRATLRPSPPGENVRRQTANEQGAEIVSCSFSPRHGPFLEQEFIVQGDCRGTRG